MLYEYALEPSLLSSWSDFRFYVSQFGFDCGRLIVRFPGKTKWKRMVYESLVNCKDIERKRIEEALLRIDSRMVSREGASWTPGQDWLSNAVREHSREPFRAIIAEGNDRSHPSVIVGSTLDVTQDLNELPVGDSRRLWKATRSRVIKRAAAEMAETIAGFIKHSKHILFIDPHFGPENDRHLLPFAEFMGRLYERPGSQMPERIEIHCGKKSTPEFFKEKCHANLSGKIPHGVKVRCVRWVPDGLHNRFILTDRGGLAFLTGLDQRWGCGPDDDVVVLLDKDVNEQLLQEYSMQTPRFTLQDECEIVGLMCRPE